MEDRDSARGLRERPFLTRRKVEFGVRTQNFVHAGLISQDY